MRERVGEKRRVIKHQFKEAREVNRNKGGAEGRDEERGGYPTNNRTKEKMTLIAESSHNPPQSIRRHIIVSPASDASTVASQTKSTAS